MVLIVGKSKAGFGVGQPVLRGQTRRELSTHSTRPVRILEETPRLEIKANVKVKGQASVHQNLGEPRENTARVQSEVEGGCILRDKKVCTQGE